MNHKCPKCQINLVWDTNNPNRPFCSERCKNIDFIAWANEENALAAEPSLDDADFFE